MTRSTRITVYRYFFFPFLLDPLDLNLDFCLQSKCERYWPEIGETVEYDKVTVHNNSEIVNTDYVLREFSIIRDDEERKIFHYHFQVSIILMVYYSSPMLI